MTAINISGKDRVLVQWKKLELFFAAALESKNVRSEVAERVIEALLQTSLRGVDSHGIELFPHYLKALDSARINPNPNYKYTQTGPATCLMDANHSFGHSAGAEAMLKAIGMAKEAGAGLVGVNNSTHFGAAAYYALIAAEADMIGMSFTNADSLMLTHAGVRPFFGTNPICFAAPCESEDPFCLDMATTRSSWNKMLRTAETGHPIPSAWACDIDGKPTTDASLARSLAPIGNYKGFGLGMMIEILCSVLTGMPFGRDITRMYSDPIDKKRFLGHFFIAIDIARFEKIEVFKKRLQLLINEVRQEPRKNQDIQVMVPGDPEKLSRERRTVEGIPVTSKTHQDFMEIASLIGFKW